MKILYAAIFLMSLFVADIWAMDEGTFKTELAMDAQAVQALGDKNLELFFQLVADGADVNDIGPVYIRQVSRKTGYSKAQVIEILLHAGLEVNKPNQYSGSTLLHHTVRNNWEEASKMLIARGADPSRKDFEGRTPFDFDSVPLKTQTALQEYVAFQRELQQCAASLNRTGLK